MSAPTQARAVARENLTRTVAFELVRAEGEGGDGRTVDGYGAVFNSPTQIDSWEGTFAEQIAPGAFRKSIRENTPRMQFDHGHHPLLGSLPIGRWETVEEDERGLHVVGRLSDNWLVQPFRDAIADGAVDGMSFRFSVVRDEWVDAAGKKIRDEELPDLLYYGAGERGPITRTLKEVRVSEVGPVTWPAYADTSVGVRAGGDGGTGGGNVTVVDLGRLDLRTERARAALARAVALADRLTPVPDVHTSTPAHVHTSTEEPRATADPAADEHAVKAPQVTAEPAAGEHSSPTARPVRSAAAMRSAISRRRQIVDQIKRNP